MNLARTAGLVLRTRPLTETSLIVQWLTRDFGRIATVAKGARRPKSPFRGQLDLFYLADLSFSRSSRSELHTLREVRLLESHAGLRPELIYVQQASYCSALIEQTAEPDAPMPAVFQSFCALLAQLPKHPAQPQTIFGFEIKWLQELGLKPNLAETKLTPGTKQILERLLVMKWPEIFRLRLSPAQARELRVFLHDFIVFHLDRIPRGEAPRWVALISDRNANEHFTPLTVQNMLAQVAALPITEWNYKDDSAAKRHIGPMAQDFHAAFGLNGADEKHISTVDEGGVALAAIQGLNQKLEDRLKEKEAELQELKGKNDSLAEKLNELEATVKLLAGRK